MHSFISTIASTAFVFSSFASAAPVVTVPGPAAPAAPIVPPIILAPVRSSRLSTASVSTLAAAKVQPIAPHRDVILQYASTDPNQAMTASVNATMKFPSVLLEDIDSISKVDCSAKSVSVTFNNKADYDETAKDWPASGFVLFTNHLGDCDTDNQRGLYIVDSVTRNDKTLTVIAASTKSTFDNSTSEMTVDYTKPSNAKRAIAGSWFADIPKSLVLQDDPTKKSIAVSVHDPKLGGDLSVNGHLHFSWLKLKPTSFFVDIDLGLSASINVKATASVSSGNDVLQFAPASLTVSAFSIPGILDVGPAIAFKMGCEISASGTAEISADLTAEITNGHAHIDFLDKTKTVSSGWKPVFKHAVNVSAAIEAQVNPFVELTAEMAVKFLGGLLDLSSGVTAKPTLLNVFSLQAQFNIDNANKITIPPATDKNCINGFFFSSTFNFVVTAFVTQFYDVEVFRFDAPVFDSGCWTWAPDVIAGTAKPPRALIE
ncbi:hypothetical protein VTL71DRAFT_6211 [Oculimacula yallundae]|uniref:Isoamyl alcohol n=1 Tax=Oculimacula yallundae TaxID=86028 RepID=A0ABR4C1C5_9HELO